MALKALIISVILAVILHRVLKILYVADYHKTVYNHAPGPCHLVEGIEHGSEDIQVLPNGLAFVSSGVLFSGLKPDEAAKRVGQIFLINLNDSPKPVSLKVTEFKGQLHPHGMYVFQDKPSGGTFVYIVNHGPEKSVIEKFQFDEATKSLKHLHSFSDPTFKYLNELVVVAMDQFYFTNFLYYHHTFELTLALSWGEVGYYDGKGGHILLSNLNQPNGINVDRKRKMLYVMAFGGRELDVYEITNPLELNLKQTIHVGSGCDNVDVNPETGDIWTGCHPVFHEIMTYLGSCRPEVAHSPSQVLRIQVDEESGLVKDNGVTEVYSDTGKKFSTSSIAVVYKSKLLVGSVCSHLLYCDIKYM